ncbi:DUF1002 domain-containing protein [Bianquea renquensis]|uniref:DUF1002 domain-containing protein n=1 Tax=Bianquea renquensis TaxID=2763661 RepID=A0A926I1D4_9FIRM|nr:DUF1002 domain-containing protein [Bianquea renquensis]MBC8542871.1 DUF1002 domain-containing protein [Bianquea renquensis]
MKRLWSLCLMGLLLLIPMTSRADTAVGDSIAILGEDLTDAQKEALLEEFGVEDDTLILTITNKEEHETLGNIVPSGKIGSKAISSAMITYTEKGSGLDITTSEHITYITKQNYADALITAGITDAKIQISAPYDVSGTAALTGIMKAYETSSGATIDPEVKEAVNEEVLLSVTIGDELASQAEASGQDTETAKNEAQKKASDIVSDIKVTISEQKPETREQIETIVTDTLQRYEVSLSDETYAKLVSLFDKMRTLDIDWDTVASNIKNKANQVMDTVTSFANSEEGQGFLNTLKGWFESFLDWLKGLFA